MRLALIEDLLTEPLPTGSNLLVEYDAASQWYRASLNIAREWLRDGGRSVAAQAAKYFRKRKGLVRWRGVIDQGLAKQVVIEVDCSSQGGYFSHAFITSIHTERITRLARNTANTQNDEFK
jgi:hypothetical protein